MTSLADPEDQYKKYKQLKREDVKSLKEWADKQAHLPRISELQAILFLHSCYYSNERAKNTIETFFTARTHSADMFAQLNPTESPVIDYSDVCVFAVLPQTTPEGYRVIYCKILDSEPARYIQTMALKIFDMVCQLCLHQKGTEGGQIIIMDMNGIVLGHVGRLSLLTTKIYLHYLQEGMPVRLKGFHVINVVSFVDKVMAFMKPFMKKELLDIFHLHTTNLETLFKFVPQQCLPQELGGNAGSYAELLEKQLRDLKESVDFFIELEKQVVDETKRIEKTDYRENVFGLEGTFKKLTID